MFISTYQDDCRAPFYVSYGEKQSSKNLISSKYCFKMDFRGETEEAEEVT